MYYNYFIVFVVCLIFFWFSSIFNENENEMYCLRGSQSNHIHYEL